ncbi:hypothetical protein PCE1_001143 [Barthelona sp. PCE]
MLYSKDINSVKVKLSDKFLNALEIHDITYENPCPFPKFGELVRKLKENNVANHFELSESCGVVSSIEEKPLTQAERQNIEAYAKYSKRSVDTSKRTNSFALGFGLFDLFISIVVFTIMGLLIGKACDRIITGTLIGLGFALAIDGTLLFMRLKSIDKALTRNEKRYRHLKEKVD